MTRKHLLWASYMGILSGTWPQEDIDDPVLRRLYQWYQIFTNGYQLLFTLGMVIQLARLFWYADEKDNHTSEILENYSMTIIYIMACAKMYVCGKTTKAAELLKKIDQFEDEMQKKGLSEKQNKICKFYIVYIKSILGFSVYMGYGEGILYLIFPRSFELFSNGQLAKNKRLPLPFSCWIPLDRERHYYFLYFLHVLGVIYGVGTTLAPDNFLYAILIFVMEQFKILHDKIANFVEVADAMAKESRTEVEVIREILLKKYAKTHFYLTT